MVPSRSRPAKVEGPENVPNNGDHVEIETPVPKPHKPKPTVLCLGSLLVAILQKAA